MDYNTITIFDNNLISNLNFAKQNDYKQQDGKKANQCIRR